MANPWENDPILSPGGQSAGPVYGPPPKAPAPPTELQIRADARAERAAERADRAEQRAEAKEQTGAAATEAERKAGAFLIRAIGANNSYEGIDVSPNEPGVQRIGPRSLVGQAMADNVPNLLNVLPSAIGNSPQRQVADSAQDEFIAASLRQDSGAAIPPEELERQRRIYFPMPGDGPEAIEAKRQARLRAIEGLKQSGGRLTEGAMQREAAMGANEPKIGLPAETENEDDGLVGSVTDDAPARPGDPGYSNPTGPRHGMGTIATGGGGFMGQLGTATQNTLAGLAQGVAGLADLPMEAATGVQRGLNYATGQGGGALLDMAGLDRAADWWRGSSQAYEQDMASRPSLSGLIEQASPTPEGGGAARLAAQFIGGAAVPFGPKRIPKSPLPTQAATPAAEVIEEGARNNVRVMTSDVRPPKTFIGKSARAMGERIPYAGTGGPRAKQQAERIEAVKDLAKDFGVDGAEELLDEVADDLTKTRGGQVTALTKQKNAVIDGVQDVLTPTDVQNTLTAIQRETARLEGINAESYAPVISRLRQFGANLASGKTLRQVEGNRKLLGDMFEDPSLASIKSEGQKAINAIYAPLRDDMGNFIGVRAGPAARQSWTKANNRLAAMAGELDDNVFRGVLKNAETTPENVAKLLFSKKPSEVRRLVAGLSPEGRRKAQGAVIARAMEKAGDDVSPDKFASEITRLGKSIGVIFESTDLARVNGLQKLLQATRQAATASVAPPTGAQNMPFLMGAGAGLTGPVSIPILGTAGGLARLYESAAVRNLLVGLGRAKPGSKGESQLLERILKVATSQMQIRGGANDVLAQSPVRAVAEEQEQD